jgi:hypothetical protein
MPRTKAETVEVVESTETVEAVKAVETTKSAYPKTYTHSDSKSELMFANTKFSKGRVTIETAEQEKLLMKTLDYQEGKIKA